jgi:hypothetical protein
VAASPVSLTRATARTIAVSNSNAGGSAGMGDPVQNRGIVFVDTAALASRPPRPSIGPVAGTPSAVSDPPVHFATTAGDLSFTAIDSVGFQAMAVAPEPASAALLDAGALMLAGRRAVWKAPLELKARCIRAPAGVRRAFNGRRALSRMGAIVMLATLGAGRVPGPGVVALP